MSILTISFFFAEPKLNAATFCRVFPFHIMFDRSLKIKQTGSTVARVIPKVTSPNCKITDILDTVNMNLFSFSYVPRIFG